MVRRLFLGLALCTFTAAEARAQDRDPAAAQALFDQARALMTGGNYAEACPRLAESQRLDPGIGTQFHLADCYEKQGKLASAWAAFLEVASTSAAAGQADREQAAKNRASRLESRLPSLTIVVPGASRAEGLRVLRDDVEVREIQWGSSLPVDPGEHRVTVSAPGRRTFTNAVTLKEGTTATITVPTLAMAPDSSEAAPVGASTPPVAPEPASESTETPPPDRSADAEPSSGPSGLVIGLGVVGVVGLGAGTVLGLMASSKFDDSKKSCDPDNENLCDADGVALRDDAFTLGNLSTVGFIVGGVALAGAGTIWLVQSGSSGSETHARNSLRAGVRSNGAGSTLVVRGSF